MARIGFVVGYQGNNPGLDALVASYEGSTAYGVDNVFFDHKTATDDASLFALASAAAQTFASNNGFSFASLEPAFDVMSGGVPIFANPTLTLNTARRASTTRIANVTVSVEQSTTLSLSGGQTCNAFLEYADDSGFTTNVKEIGRSTNGNTGTLTIGLNITQVNTATITGMVPANKYYRIRTTGTGTQTFRSAQEVLL